MRAAFEPSVRAIVAERARLFDELSGVSGVRAWPSAGNFLLIRVPQAARVRARLRDEHGVLVRDFSAKRGLEDCLRVTVGTPEENTRFLEGLREIVGKG